MKETPSPFYEDLPDPRARERAFLHAREVYVEIKENRQAAMQGHIGYGKWLIGSLLALHAGSIYVLMNLRTVLDPGEHGALVSAASLNVFGIASIIVAGFCAWLNFQIAEQRYIAWLNPAMLYRSDHWPTDPETKYDPISATLYLAAAAGFLSWLSLIMAAAEIFAAMRG